MQFWLVFLEAGEAEDSGEEKWKEVIFFCQCKPLQYVIVKVNETLDAIWMFQAAGQDEVHSL